MASRILITRLNNTLANGDVAGASCSITLSGGKHMAWSGKLSDGNVFDGGEIPEGEHVVSANSDGAFAFTIISTAPTPEPVPPATKKRAPRKPSGVLAGKSDETSQQGKHRQARNARSK